MLTFYAGGLQIRPNCDFRLVFEIKFVTQLFDDYKPVKLMIWRTYTDTNLRAILAM